MKVTELLKYKFFLQDNISYSSSIEEKYLVIFSKSISKDNLLKDHFNVSFFKRNLIFNLKDTNKKITIDILPKLIKEFNNPLYEKFYLKDEETNDILIIEKQVKKWN